MGGPGQTNKLSNGNILKIYVPSKNRYVCWCHHICMEAVHHILYDVLNIYLYVFIFVVFHRSTKTHPGPVVHLSDSPKDEGKVQETFFFFIFNVVVLL